MKWRTINGPIVLFLSVIYFINVANDHQLAVWEVKEVRTELNRLVGTDYHKLELILKKLKFF